MRRSPLNTRHLVLQLGGLAHAPLEHAREPHRLRDGEPHVAAVLLCWDTFYLYYSIYMIV